MKNKRNRLTYAVIIAMVIVAGLASRSSLAQYLPLFIATYAGDTLWALTVFLAFGFIFPTVRTAIAVLLAISVSFGVEFSQLYQAEWINTVRNTQIGALTLGFGFKWSDLLCYTAGCLLGLTGELLADSMQDDKKTNH